MRESIVKKILIMFVMVLFIMPTSIVNASGSIDINKSSSITIKHFNNNKPISNTNFSLYLVGKISEDEQFTISDDFSNYNIDLSSINNQSKWSELADTLATYIQIDNKKSYRDASTKDDGTIKFDNLKTGLYLVVADTAILENSSIKAKPFLVSLPSKDTNSGDWIYDIDVFTKNEELVDKDIDFTVEKIWINDESLSNKPTSIEVDLYRDDKIYDSIVLSESNKWKYIWENLDSKYNWTAVEKNVPKDYKVSYEKYSTSIKIKNTYNNPNTSVTPPTSVLPQTGSPWIIAQVFALIGLISISVGYIIKRKNG